MHRPLLVFRQPNLLSIDGIPISAEERAKADMYFLDYQVIVHCDSTAKLLTMVVYILAFCKNRLLLACQCHKVHYRMFGWTLKYSSRFVLLWVRNLVPCQTLSFVKIKISTVSRSNLTLRWCMNAQINKKCSVIGVSRDGCNNLCRSIENATTA